MRILIVEDQADIRAVLRETLADAGHEVTLAANYDEGAGALTGAAQSGAGWDLLLTDLLLPGGSGLALAALARAQGGRVLLCSGHPRQLEELERLGIAHLRKPFPLRHLLDQIDAVTAAPPP